MRYKPLSLVISVLGEILAGAVFMKVWVAVSGEEETPKATSPEYSTKEVLVAAAVHAGRQWSCGTSHQPSSSDPLARPWSSRSTHSPSCASERWPVQGRKSTVNFARVLQMFRSNEGSQRCPKERI